MKKVKGANNNIRFDVESLADDADSQHLSAKCIEIDFPMCYAAAMKKFILSTVFTLGVSILGAQQVAGQDANSSAIQEVSAVPTEMTPVAMALEKAGYLTKDKAKADAQYYIFICSASWCTPCRRLMPYIVEEYQKSIKNDSSVSLILLGYDSTEEGCRKYLEHYNTDMPGVFGRKELDLPNRPKLPYIPFAFVMDAQGKLITSGRGNIVLDWKNKIQTGSAQ